MLGDIRYALRTFAKRPSFAVAAIATLALGIAVNTIAFSLVNSLAFRPLPVPEAGRVVRIYPVDERGRRRNLFSYPDVVDLRAQAADALETLAAYVPAEMTAGRTTLDRGVVTPRPALAYIVSSSYFDVTRVRPALGRILQPSDDGPGGRSVVISDGFWQRRFNGEAAAIGATIWLNAEPFTIAGVVAPGFAGTEPLAADVWMPVSAIRVIEPGADYADRDRASFLVLGRLRAGVTAGRANRLLDVIAQRLAAAYPGKSRPRATEVAAGTFFTLEAGLKPVIAGALVIVGLVLLIACGNVANLTLARAISRQREIAVRLAIGASRSRIVRQLAVEALLLSLAAGVVGLLLSTWTLRLLYVKALALNPFWWTVSLTLAPDVRVFAYTLGIAAMAGLAFGFVPALQAVSPGVVAALNDSRTVAGARVGGARLRHGLVVLQVAGSLVLLMTAGLLARGLKSAEALNLGFSTHDVISAEFNLRAQGYSAERAAAFTAALLERLSSVGGVARAAVTSHIPLHGGVRRITMRLADASTAEPVSVTVTTVSPQYFDVLGVGFVAGRNLDAGSGARPIVISEGLARRFWPGQPAIGKTMTSDAWGAPRTIVGVVRDAATTAIWREKELAVYLPVDEADPRDVFAALVRTTGDPSAVRAAMEAIGAALDPNLRFTVMPIDTLLQFWLLPSRVAAATAGVLALIAIVLAAFGLYAVLSFAVSHRLHEIGIRMALGATSQDVISLVLTEAWRLLAAGFAIGGLAAAATAPFLGRLLFGVSAFDPLTIAGATVVLAAAALAASYVPARRAARLEPLSVLRAD